MSGPAVILCADDYAMTEGISRGIEQLAEARRLSATSAMVTTRHWAGLAPRVLRLRERIAVGLHLNLTLGRPLGAMPALAPSGLLPALPDVIKQALARRINAAEIAAETERQVARFADVTGVAPDFIDGHQHVHALPGVRDGVLAALERIFPHHKPLLRDPADRVPAIIGRGAAVAKAVLLAGLAKGFGERARIAGFRTNRGFAGASAFDRSWSYAAELGRFLSHPGPLHLIMCHPGIPDEELATLDPVVGRRQDELDAITAFEDLPDLIWHPVRDATGAVVWPAGGSR